MYYIKRRIVRLLYKFFRKTPDRMPMVRYWKTKAAAAAKVMTHPDGHMVMQIEGEDELFPGFPRSHSLFGTLSKLKHEIKNQIFNESWAKLEANVPIEEIIRDVKQKIVSGMEEFMALCRYDALPPYQLVPPVKELWRVLTVLEKKEPKLKLFKEMMCFIMNEDDAYRFRLQWLLGIFRPRWWGNPIDLLELAFDELINAEVIGDMKERQQLLKRIVLMLLKDKKIRSLFDDFCKEADWNKLTLTKADKYHFRGKYFKVDFDKFEY